MELACGASALAVHTVPANIADKSKQAFLMALF
jgi:hypothetical protein